MYIIDIYDFDNTLKMKFNKYSYSHINMLVIYDRRSVYGHTHNISIVLRTSKMKLLY